jgi:hypothetical protein
LSRSTPSFSSTVHMPIRISMSALVSLLDLPQLQHFNIPISLRYLPRDTFQVTQGPDFLRFSMLLLHDVLFFRWFTVWRSFGASLRQLEFMYKHPARVGRYARNLLGKSGFYLLSRTYSLELVKKEYIMIAMSLQILTVTFVPNYHPILYTAAPCKCQLQFHFIK